MGESEAESEKCGNSSPDSDYPTLETTSFDLITIGTALPQSMLSSAAASSIPNKTVLHIDPNPFYGSFFSSLSLSSFISLLQNHTSHPSSDTLRYRPLVSSSVDIASHSQALPASSSRSFSLDVSGPRLLFCADPIVDLMLRSGASHHVEFKSLDATLLFSPRSNPQLSPVPDSREAIFKDKTLGLTEKTQLMRFFKLVRSHFDGDDCIGDDDLDTPFVDFLHRQRLPPNIKAYRSNPLSPPPSSSSSSSILVCKTFISFFLSLSLSLSLFLSCFLLLFYVM